MSKVLAALFSPLGIFQTHIHPPKYYSLKYLAHVTKSAISYYESKKLYDLFPLLTISPSSHLLSKISFDVVKQQYCKAHERNSLA